MVSDALIYAMSTRGSMPLDQFYDLFSHVYFPANEDSESIRIDDRSRIARILDSLGYCEFNYNQRKIYMCKPSLILLPACGLPTALLVGARTPRLVDQLKKAIRERTGKASLRYYNHSGSISVVPRSIYVEAVDINVIKEIANNLNIHFEAGQPAAWSLANMSASLRDIQNSLTFERREELNWKKRVFVNGGLVFRDILSDSPIQYLAEYKDPVSLQRLHRFWIGDEAAEVDRNWGRYLSLTKSNSNILLYNEKQYKMAVPLTTPLPCLLARAISLCSGMAPISPVPSLMSVEAIPREHPMQVYSNVTPAISKLVADKLGQNLIKVPFRIDNGGIQYD